VLMKKGATKFWIRVVLLLSFASLAEAGILTIQNREVVTGKARELSHATMFPRRAQEQFLNLSRTASYALPKAAIAQGEIDTITILAIRVDFQLEDPDDPLTTGSGKFDMRDAAAFISANGHAMDRAPHNRQYFEAHLRALARYWKAVSHDKLCLKYEVWPQATDSCYHLDTTMGYYGAQDPSYGLGEFFHNAVRKAYDAEEGNLRFRDERGHKKAVIVFHAGADQQGDVLWDTPRDFYTGFLTFDTANWVVLSADTVVEGIVMPETMSQDSRVTVMNAVMAHEFGHQLGLVDIYNTGSSPAMTQVGNFDLMDNNAISTAAVISADLNVFGAVPIFPSAWERAFLGFDEVYEFRSGTSLRLAAVKLLTVNPDIPRIIKVPISSTEYYLLENRRTTFDSDSVGFEPDDSTDVILGPVKYVEDVLTPQADYDYFLPNGSSGIAVWHVDESVAALDYDPFHKPDNNFDANTLQWDYNRRFLYLVEADGFVDFGPDYFNGYGSARDLFYAGNNTTFGTTTNPASVSNDGGYTHILVSHVSSPDTTMSFDLSQEWMPQRFPRRVSIPTNPDLSPVAVDLDRDGQDEILAVSNKRILAVSVDGHDFLDPDDEQPDLDTIYSPINSTTDANSDRPRQFDTASMPVFAELSGEISTNPVTVTVDDTIIVLVGTAGDSIYAFLPEANRSAPDAYRARRFWAHPVGEKDTVKAILVDKVRGQVHVFNSKAERTTSSWNNSSSPITTAFTGALVGVCRYDSGMAVLTEIGDESILYLTRDVALGELSDRNAIVADSVLVPEIGFHSPIATDFNRDGIDEIVLLSRSGHILCYSFDAGEIEVYPFLDKETGDTALAGPAVGDFSGTGYPELIVPGTNRLYGYDRNGLELVDFPLTLDRRRLGQLIRTVPIISDINGDRHPDITVVAIDTVLRTRTTQIEIEDTTYSYYNYFSNLYGVSPGVFRIDGFPVSSGAYGVRALDNNT